MRIAKDWALASDGFQWILHRRRRQQSRRCWRPVCFVRSTRGVLERCMREKGRVFMRGSERASILRPLACS